MKRVLIVAIITIQIANAMASNLWAQTQVYEPPEFVCIESWKKGSSRVNDQSIQIVLSKTNSKYQREIVGTLGERFVLTIKHNPYRKLELEHWEIGLFEAKSDSKFPPNLLASEEHSIFPSYLGVLYPRLQAIAVSSDDTPLYGDGYPFPYIYTVRKVKVAEFNVEIKVISVKMNNDKPNRVNEMEVLVKFSGK